MGINNRVRHGGNIADNTDTHLHANDSVFDEYRTQIIKYLLPCIESREQANNQDASTHKNTNQNDDRPTEPVHTPAVGIGSSKHHHQEPEDHNHNANNRQDRGDESNLWPRLVQVTEIRCDDLDGCHHIDREKITDLRNGVDRGDTVEPRDSISTLDVSPVFCNYDEIGDGLGEVRGGSGDGGKHRIGIGQVRIVGHKGQQSWNFGADLIKRQHKK